MLQRMREYLRGGFSIAIIADCFGRHSTKQLLLQYNAIRAKRDVIVNNLKKIAVRYQGRRRA